MADIRELQDRAVTFLKAGTRAPGGEVLGADFAEPSATEGRRFSHFDPADQRQAMEIVRRLMDAAEGAGGGEAGLEAALAEAERAAADYPVAMVKYALMVFITHHREGSRLPIPPLAEREPMVLLRSPRGGVGGAVAVADTEEPAADPERQLDWYREDVYANEHHEHWHVVYPFGGVPVPGGQRRLKDRQGELFVYMHEQMLARYDTERLAVALDPAAPLADYGAAIAEGYDSGIPGFAPRPPDLKLADVQLGPGFTYTVAMHEQRRDRLFSAIEDKAFQGPGGQRIEITADRLGATGESSIGSVSGSDPRSFYGAHHNFGHVLIAAITSQLGDDRDGVMAATSTAIRDPVFYRWHRHVDDVSFAWQETQAANDLSDAPNVVVRKRLGAAADAGNAPDGGVDGGGAPADGTIDSAGGPAAGDATAASGDLVASSPDVILAFRDAIPGAGEPGFDGQAFGRAAFGGDHWDEDFSQGELTTAELETRMLTREEQGFPVTYLDQREYVYFIRAENLEDAPRDVTVRLWLCSAEKAEERRWWIELDKFRHTLEPRERAVIYRPAWLSSVIRKPASKPPQPVQRTGAGPRDNYCECGWPYNLLLPRGTREGMPFRLLVMLTAWAADDVAADGSCGSMSFCGARDRYPDKRAMGYPFDRPFPADRGIAATIAAQPNMTARDVTIRWVDE